VFLFTVGFNGVDATVIATSAFVGAYLMYMLHVLVSASNVEYV